MFIEINKIYNNYEETEQYRCHRRQLQWSFVDYPSQSSLDFCIVGLSQVLISVDYQFQSLVDCQCFFDFDHRLTDSLTHSHTNKITTHYDIATKNIKSTMCKFI